METLALCFVIIGLVSIIISLVVAIKRRIDDFKNDDFLGTRHVKKDIKDFVKCVKDIFKG